MLDTEDLDVSNGNGAAAGANGDPAAAAAAAIMEGVGDVSPAMAALLAQQAAAQSDRDKAKGKMQAALEARKRHEDKDHPAGAS
jgi:F0F1-type ATP synthase epsilon subunit